MYISVSCGFGAETALKRQLKYWGIDAPCENGRFTFQGTFEDIINCNLYLSTADKVYLELKKFNAETFDQLFDNIIDIPWEDFISKNGQILIKAKSVKSKLFALSAIQSITKKAITQRLLKKYAILEEKGNPHYIEISILKNEVKISLNTSGESLHKRGYRDLVWEAPIRETLAASIIELSGYNGDGILLDPFTGSGTIPIEGAMKALCIPSGLYRSFAFENYIFMDKNLLYQAKKVGEEKILRDKKLKIFGYDIKKKAIQLAMHHASNFNLQQYIHFEVQDMKNIKINKSNGIIITNPPYGERLMNEMELKEIYKNLGILYKNLEEWKLLAITAHEKFEIYFGRKATKTRKYFNANIPCRLYQFDTIIN